MMVESFGLDGPNFRGSSGEPSPSFSSIHKFDVMETNVVSFCRRFALCRDFDGDVISAGEGQVQSDDGRSL
jgi:hypothetical protein